jgi:hypothetical protein
VVNGAASRRARAGEAAEVGTSVGTPATKAGGQDFNADDADLVFQICVICVKLSRTPIVAGTTAQDIDYGFDFSTRIF